jgi:acetyl-CoA acetyltransferase
MEVTIAGVGMHPFGRFPDASLKDLARVAVIRALEDSEMAIHDVQAVYSSNALAGMLQGQEQIRGQSVLREIGIEQVPVQNIENACASGSSAFREAVIAVKAGVVTNALVVGFEKMFVQDRSRTLSALQTAADQDVVGGLGLQFTAIEAMSLYEQIGRGLLTVEDCADASVKNHYNASLNPYAQHREQVDRATVMSARRIAGPLTLLMCSSFCDGAAAVMVTNSDRTRVGAPPKVWVKGMAAVSGFTASTKKKPDSISRCAALAYEDAGVGPQDIDVAEVHDAMAPAEIERYEQLRFCEAGAGAEFFRAGATSLSGSLPVNPSGGLSSRGHPVGATGLAQIAELVWQLRGEAGKRQVSQPRIALAQNAGGWLEGEPACCNIHILERAVPWD